VLRHSWTVRLRRWVSGEAGSWPSAWTGCWTSPGPGGPATVSVEAVEAVVVATMEETPQNATHWSRASMAKRSGLSKTTIGRIWKAFELQPHRVDGFKLSKDPRFEVLGVWNGSAGSPGPPAHA